MRLFSCTSDSNNHCRRRRRRRRGHRRRHIFTHSELAAATSNFSSSSLLGGGSQSSVFLAIFPSSPPLIAAAKLPSSFSELSILSSLPDSPLIVNLLGFTHPSPSIPLLELMPCGSLDHLLHGRRHPPPPPPPPPSWPRRLHLALLSSLSLSFLHSLSPPIIHRDVKPSNILLDSSLNPRLSDFGLAVTFPSLSPPAGTLGYLDPSYTSPHLLTTKTDVFSFGVVLLELITGRRAIDVDHSPPALSDWGLTMVTQSLFDEMWDKRMGPVVIDELAAVACLAARCVSPSPAERPEMNEVVACLRRVRSPPVRWRKWITRWAPV